MASKPTQRTLAELREQGFLCAIVEHWNHYSRRRIDLFGFIDIVALKPGVTIGVQCTDGSSVSKRIGKILTECRDAAMAWIAAGNAIEVWGWAKRGGRGQRKTWTASCRAIKLADFELTPEAP